MALMQSACRVPHSTETAMMRVVNDIISATDNKALSVLLSLEHQRGIQQA